MAVARHRWGWAVAAMVVGITACAALPDTGGTVFDDEGVRFVAPPGWSVRESRSVSAGPGRVLAYIANQPLQDDCNAVRADCHLPISDLRAGGVFIWWLTATCVAAACELPDGAPMAVGRRQAVRSSEAACPGLDVTSMEQVAVIVTPQRIDRIVICARDPDDASLAAVESILESITWRVP